MPMSRIRYTLNEKVGDPKDWAYTWAMTDDVTLGSSCDFCGQDQQRLTYEVSREDETLWICQRCVGRYPVTGVLDGTRLDAATARVQIHGLTARQKQRTCQEAIKKAQSAAADANLSEVVVYFDRNLQLSPQYAAVLFGVLSQLPEPIDTRIFEIQTRSTAHQDEFGVLEERDRILVWSALSPLQRRRLASRGFAPAGTPMRKMRSKSGRETELQLAGSRMTALSEPADHNQER